MMKRALLSAALLSSFLTLPCTATAQDLASQIVGVWKRTSFVQKELATGTATKPFGENVGGTAFFTPNGHFAWIIVPTGLSATHAQRVQLFSAAPFGSGTYKVEGTSLTLKYGASSNSTWTGTERRAEIQVSGNTLTWTSAPYQSMDGKELVGIATLERME